MIIGWIEHDRGILNKLCLEMLTVGRCLAHQLHVPLHAILIGEVARPLADELAAYGVSTVYLAQDKRLDEYAPEAWAESVGQIIHTLQPEVVMAVSSDRGNEVMAHVAARTNRPLATDCTEIHPGHPYLVTRLRYGGSLLEDAQFNDNGRNGDEFNCEVKLLTIAPHSVQAESAPSAAGVAVQTFTPVLTDKDFRVRVTERLVDVEGGTGLAEARVVIGGGRGVGSAQGFEMLEELAGLLGGAVGCSRAVTSDGWRSHADQIGQTGTRIAPELYIACGISGAIQHMVGCAGAKRILAINTDPDAPILARADYAIVADLHEFIPELVANIKRVQSKA